MKNTPLNIDGCLVACLIAEQFPKWKDLPITPVKESGWDNRTFHLGKKMLVRLPSAPCYEAQVEKESIWLPKLAPYLPLEIPTPVAKGEPSDRYPLKWSIYEWIEGTNPEPKMDLDSLAFDLATFLCAFHKIDTRGAPPAGEQNFYRGGPLSVYDKETRHAISLLKDKVDTSLALGVWEKALASSWQHPPVWIHGDISLGNLLVRGNKLSAVIDFGQLATGDPACDLVIAWTLLHGESRNIFQDTLHLDKTTWERAKGWALWKALLAATGAIGAMNFEATQCWNIINKILED